LLVLDAALLVFAAATLECAIHTTYVITGGFKALVTNVFAFVATISRALGR
jgi:hypothetical protein